VKSDEALMLAYRDGDVTAFNELFCRYAPVLERVLRRFGPTPDVIADLVQQTFLQLHRARFDFRPDGELRPWLMTIAFNLAREQLRRKRRRPEAAIEAAADESLAQPPVEQSRFEARSDLTAALQHLPPDQQEVVRLHFVEELSFEEIGTRVGASTGAVRVRAHRGYTALRKLLSAGNVNAPGGIDPGAGS
jgi:RNA polymerase sigma-70 factor (ECF subfamily)